VCQQLALPPNRGAKHAIHDWSLSLWDEPDSFMDRRMWRSLEEEKLIQPEAQNITKIDIDLRTAQAADPKIQQR
jgi:hypothetical protein